MGSRLAWIVALFATGFCAVGCGDSTGATAPPTKPVTQADVDKMTPEQREVFEKAMASMNAARRATRGQAPIPVPGAGVGN